VGDDTALLLEARGGSTEALDRLFERTAPRLLALIRVRMGRSLRAQLESRDILQASLLKAFEGVDTLEAGSSSSFMAWLARIAQNEISDRADYHRRQKRDAARAVPLDEVGKALAARVRSGASRLILDEQVMRVEQALEELDPDHREVIVLRKYEELSFKEVGERMGRSPDACRMLLARALTALTLRLRT
jgi:RNA polymerase sigma-70 factor (ECF subfamily)